MKKQIARVLLLAMLAVMLFGTAPRAKAAEETADIFHLDKITHMMVNVTYTADKPTVYFLAPDGAVYDDTAVESGKMRMAESEKVLTYWIPNAMAGQWQIVYDKGNNEKLNIDWTTYVEVVRIRAFTYQVKEDAPDRLEAKLEVGYLNDSWYRYRIYAAVTDETGKVTGTRELCDGTAETNQTAEFTVNISQLATYDQYYLMAEVELKDGDATATDSMLGTTAFGYTNADMPAAMQGVHMEINVTDGTLELDWEDYKVNCGSYVLGVYTDDVSVYANTFEESVTATRIPIDMNAAKVKVQLGYTTSYGGDVSALLTREVELSHANAVVIETEEITADTRAKIRYDFSAIGGEVDTMILLGEVTEMYKLSGSDTMTVALELFDNDLTVCWYLDADTCFTVEKSIYSDNVAPSLKLQEVGGDITTDLDTYILIGSTAPNCTVTVNDVAVEVDASGSFMVELELTEDVNAFTVRATNSLGVSTAQSFRVIRAGAQVITEEDAGDTGDETKGGFGKKLLSFLPLMLAFLAGGIMLAFLLPGPKAYTRRLEEKGKLPAIMWLSGYILTFGDILLAGVTGWSIWRYVSDKQKLSSLEFFDAASTSVADAYEMLEQNARYKSSMILWIWILGGAVVLTAALYVLAIVLKKKEGKHLPPETETPYEEPTPVIAPEYLTGGVLPEAPVFAAPEVTESTELEPAPEEAPVTPVQPEDTSPKSDDMGVTQIMKFVESLEETPEAEPEKKPGISAGGMKFLNMYDLDSESEEPEHQSLELPE